VGLRELKAQRTRDSLHAAVLTLAEELGYDGVTIEMIAERAEVGISTLYRYFPNKEAMLLDPIARNVGALADALRARPVDEPRDLALGTAIRDYLAWTPQDQDQVGRLRQQLDSAPGPRAALWDLWHQQRVLLEQALAEREGASPTELWVAVSAQVAMMVVQLAVDRAGEATEGAPILAVVEQVITALATDRFVIPALPPS
jgi:AcrR family transcriptional regulator